MIGNSARTRSFDSQVDGQSPATWSGIIAQFHDANIYQTWAYGAVRWRPQNISHLVLRRDDAIVAAAQVRVVRVPMLPIGGIAYLRWGPLCQPNGMAPDPEVAGEMVSQLHDEYVRRRGLALQIIPAAFLSSDRAASLSSAFQNAGMRPEASLGSYRTVVVDLTPPAETIRKRLDQKWRNQLNRSEKNGLTFDPSESGEAYSEFVRLYDIMWQRKQFKTTVDVEEFGRIQDSLIGPQKMKTFIARKDGDAIAALVCSLMGNAALYLLGATNERARELKAAYFLHWQAMLWLKEHGASAYDLGGIDPEANPGGYHFKSGFGGEETTQLQAHVASGRMLGDALLRGVLWLRRRRTPAGNSLHTAN